MTDVTKDEEFPYGEFDVEGEVTPVPISEALPYPGDKEQDKGDEGLGAGGTLRTGNAAIAVARHMSENGTYVGVGYCLMTVRGYYNVSAKYSDATRSWNNANHKRHVTRGRDVPRGVPVYWTGGSSGHGHIAISMGGGLCWSTDWKRPGKIDVAYIDNITSHWGLKFQGYAWEVNDVVVWRPPAPVATVSLRNLKYGRRNDDVLKVKKQLVKKGYKNLSLKNRYFGPGLRASYKDFQRHLGYTGKDADGIPGTISLRKLGFRVTR